MRWRNEIIFVNLWTGQFFEGVQAYDDYILDLARTYDTDSSIYGRDYEKVKVFDQTSLLGEYLISQGHEYY